MAEIVSRRHGRWGIGEIFNGTPNPIGGPIPVKRGSVLGLNPSTNALYRPDPALSAAG